VSNVYATLIDPPLFGSYHSVPVLGLGFVPTRGQGLFIAYIWIVNVILCAAGYEVRDPMSWYSSLEKQLMAYIGNRTGLLSFVNLAIAVLFASRNNVLLLVTNWSHSTFLLVHRWISVICMLQACVHSILWLLMYLEPLSGPDAFEEESKLSYWIWGVVATLALVLLMPLSVLPVRKKLYEVFLASHVVLAVLAMIGCMLHIYYRYEWQWGYQTWVWIAFAFWLFDRFVARPLRLVRNGVRQAFITVIDDAYLQIDVPGVEGDGHAYLYFPTFTWRVWENHPFSVAAVSSVTRADPAPSPPASRSSTQDVKGTPTGETEKRPSLATKTHRLPQDKPHQRTTPGLVLFIRTHHGLTSRLLQHADSDTGIPVLVETSYGPHMSVIEPRPSRQSLKYPNLICIAGGVGITGVLPFLSDAPDVSWGRKKLFWSVRTEPLVRAVRAVVGNVVRDGDRVGRETWGGTEVAVSVGKRFDIDAVLTEELGDVVGSTTVAVCGPAGMADEVRAVVTRLGKRGVVVRLIEESFSW
jgi:predicted ferric reductase